MGPGYSIDQMLELRRLLSKYVGEEKASEWVKNRFGRHATYGLPAIKQPDGKTKYTAYGTLENIDVRPERYMPPTGTKVTLVPNEQWNRSANAVFNFGDGISMPEVKQYGTSQPPEASLAHEGQHVLDFMVIGDDYHDRNGVAPRDSIKGKIKDSGLLRDEIHPKMVKYLGGERGITEQPESYEIVPQLRSYEAQLPAWKRLQATEFFKNLSNDAKALIMRKFFPTPKGYDAITGLSYD